MLKNMLVRVIHQPAVSGIQFLERRGLQTLGEAEDVTERDEPLKAPGSCYRCRPWPSQIRLTLLALTRGPKARQVQRLVSQPPSWSSEWDPTLFNFDVVDAVSV